VAKGSLKIIFSFISSLSDNTVVIFRSKRSDRRQLSAYSSRQSFGYFSGIVVFGVEIPSAEIHSAGYFAYQLFVVDAHDAFE